MWVALYVIYALFQAIILVRWLDKDKTGEGDVGSVILFAIMAPFVSIFLTFAGTGAIINLLLTFGKKKK